MSLRKQSLWICLLILAACICAAATERQNNADYHARRVALAKQMEGGTLVLFAPTEAEGPNNLYGFRQDDNFYYLTGWLEPGAAVLLQLGAELQGEDVRARVLHAEPLDDAAAKTQKGLRIFLRDTRPLESIARRLQMPEALAPGTAPRGAPAKPVAAVGGADGDVSLVLMLDLETEVEMKLPGRFKVSPQIAGAIKAVSGVVDVQTL